MKCFSRPNAACHSVPMGILISPKSTDQEGSGNPEHRAPSFRRSDAVMHSAEDEFLEFDTVRLRVSRVPLGMRGYS